MFKSQKILVLNKNKVLVSIFGLLDIYSIGGAIVELLLSPCLTSYCVLSSELCLRFQSSIFIRPIL